MSEFYIVTATWVKDGKPNVATFGVFRSNAAAHAERRRLMAMPAEMIHFAPKADVKWLICQDDRGEEN